MPYPQQEIRVRSFFGHEGQDALEALNLERAPEPAAPVALPTTNDAAEDLMQPEAPVVTELDEPEEEGTPAQEKRTA